MAGLKRKEPGFDAVLAEMKSGAAMRRFFRPTCRKPRSAKNCSPDFVARFGGIDVLINNAGGLSHASQ